MKQADDTSGREADRLYAELRRRILSVDLVPGSVIDEARLVQDTGVSRTPVREAIIRLVSEGLLKRDGRQVVVPSFRVGQLRPFFEALQLLTRATHRISAERRTDAQLHAIDETRRDFEVEAARGDPVGMNEANYQFHRAIGIGADNAYLQDAYDVILIQSLWLARQCYMSGADPEYTNREHVTMTVNDHVAIFEAIENRDVEKADQLAARHCDLFRERLSRQMLAPSRHSSQLLIELPAGNAPTSTNGRPTRTRSGQSI